MYPEELTELILILTLCSCSQGVQMLSSHKFEADNLKKEVWPEWLSLSVTTIRVREGQTKKMKQTNKQQKMPEKTYHWQIDMGKIQANSALPTLKIIFMVWS